MVDSTAARRRGPLPGEPDGPCIRDPDDQDDDDGGDDDDDDDDEGEPDGPCICDPDDLYIIGAVCLSQK